MKVLYAIQGTGNGHISRAREIIPYLSNYCEYDILVSGTQCDVELGVPIKFRFKGLSFTFGKKGGIDLWSTTVNASLPNMRREMNFLNVEDYDLVINDFEPISAWACRSKGVPCISLSHQGSLLSKKVPLPPKKDYFGRFVLRNYAPANAHFGFHFQAYDEFIFTPVIRKQVREIDIEELDYYTVYLPAYDDKRLVEKLSHFGNIRWHIFSKHAKKPYYLANISVFPITNDEFVADMASSIGVLCGAGFETPAEALYLKKKLMVVPMKGQYEQKCNAAALEMMGVPVIKNLKEKHFGEIGKWLESDKKVEVDYPDQTQRIIGMLFAGNSKKVIQMTPFDYQKYHTL